MNDTEGYKMGPTEYRNKNLTHLFFVDDLKLFASTLNQAKYLLDVITTVSGDIGMTFGEDKCGFIYIERGNRKMQGEPLVINGVNIKELEEGQSYIYL